MPVRTRISEVVLSSSSMKHVLWEPSVLALSNSEDKFCCNFSRGTLSSSLSASPNLLFLIHSKHSILLFQVMLEAHISFWVAIHSISHYSKGIVTYLIDSISDVISHFCNTQHDSHESTPFHTEMHLSHRSNTKWSITMNYNSASLFVLQLLLLFATGTPPVFHYRYSKIGLFSFFLCVSRKQGLVSPSNHHLRKCYMVSMPNLRHAQRRVL